MEKVDEEISFNFSRQGADTVIINNDVPSDGETTLDYTLSNMDITSNAFDSSVTQNDTVHDNTFFSDRNQSVLTVPKLVNSSPLIQCPSNTKERQCTQSTTPVTPKVRDRFNGILYHVFPSEGQIDIVFSTKELYLKFKECLDNEFCPSTPNRKNVNKYTAHVRGQRCTLTCNTDKYSIIATGPGHKLWRENNFTRLSVGLYKNFVLETNSELSYSHTSTPANRSICEGLSSTISPVLARDDSYNAHGTGTLLTEIKNQIVSLTELTSDLYGQIKTLSHKIESFPNNPDSLCPDRDVQSNVVDQYSIHTVADSILETTRRNLAQHESMMGNTPVTLPGSASYSDVASRASNSTLTNHQRQRSNEQENSSSTCNRQSEQRGVTDKVIKSSTSKSKGQDKLPSVPANSNDQQKIKVIINRHNSGQQALPIRQHDSVRISKSKKNVLLMGDSVFNRINMKGLNSNVHKHSVSGATVETLMKDIQLYDIEQFDSIVLYIGGNDLSRSTEHDLIEEQYDQLIAIIKSRNPNCKLILSNLAPRGDVDVNIINEMIERLALHHNCDIVDNYRAFFDKHGKLLLRFFSDYDPIHPSNSGMKRILGTINDLMHIVCDFQNCVFQRSASKYHQNRNFVPNNSTRMIDRSLQRNNGRCLNCSEATHSTFECRHKQPIKCWYCGLLGHKQLLCWN